MSKIFISGWGLGHLMPDSGNCQTTRAVSAPPLQKFSGVTMDREQSDPCGYMEVIVWGCNPSQLIHELLPASASIHCMCHLWTGWSEHVVLHVIPHPGVFHA